MQWDPSERCSFDSTIAAVDVLLKMPEEPGETRFASEGKGARWLLSAGRAIVLAVLIVEGGATTLEDCRRALDRDEVGKAKAVNFVRMLAGPGHQQLELHLALGLVKMQLCIEPLMEAAERSSHCSSLLLCGEYGKAAAVLRQLERSVIRIDLTRSEPPLPLTRATAYVTAEQRARRISGLAQLERSLGGALVLGGDLAKSAEPRVRGSRGGAFSLPAVLLLPRWSVWAPVLRLAVGEHQRWCCHIIKAITS